MSDRTQPFLAALGGNGRRWLREGIAPGERWLLDCLTSLDGTGLDEEEVIVDLAVDVAEQGLPELVSWTASNPERANAYVKRALHELLGVPEADLRFLLQWAQTLALTDTLTRLRDE